MDAVIAVGIRGVAPAEPSGRPAVALDSNGGRLRPEIVPDLPRGLNKGTQMATLKVHYGAWVLIGDGQKALFLHNEGDEEILNLRRLDVERHDNPATRDQGTDAPGRGHSPTGTRFGSIGGTDFHQVAEDRFAAHVAGRINAAAQENAFKEIVVVAPPKCLAEIRKDLSTEARRRVVCEIAKDYTHHPIPEIETLLAGHAMA